MKRALFLLILVLTLVGGAAYGASKAKEQGPAITFKVKTHDFGTIREADGSVSCKFEFTNTGNQPLVIISATAGCGCTKPVYDEAPVPPGKSSAITVTYNPKHRPGEFNKNVTVKTNAPKSKKVTLRISGSVIPDK